MYKPIPQRALTRFESDVINEVEEAVWSRRKDASNKAKDELTQKEAHLRRVLMEHAVARHKDSGAPYEPVAAAEKAVLKATDAWETALNEEMADCTAAVFHVGQRIGFAAGVRYVTELLSQPAITPADTLRLIVTTQETVRADEALSDLVARMFPDPIHPGRWTGAPAGEGGARE